MAWRCGGGSNNELVDNLFKHNIIQSKQVSRYFQKIHVHTFTWGSTYKNLKGDQQCLHFTQGPG